MNRTRRHAIAACAVVVLAGCTGPQTSPEPDDDDEIVVLAASSLTEPVTTITRQLRESHPQLRVRVSFAASSTLVTQVNNGADVDVLLLADEESGQKLRGDLTEDRTPTKVATNHLAIATPADNPADIESVEDLSGDVRTVMCAKAVPCGRAATAALEKAGVTPNVISYEANVKATLAKVRLGEADAALVYATDVRAAGQGVHGIAVPKSYDVTTVLPMYTLSDDPDATTFTEAMTSRQGRAVLTAAGFGRP